ncbi:MAG: peptidylprolyl isomerase [Thiogranum sp.]|nr:peptidylprolyl isomerase [Thiogranum sp.]
MMFFKQLNTCTWTVSRLWRITPHRIRNVLQALLASAMLVLPAHATIVRLDIAIGDQAGNAIYLELYDLEAPATVANFLNYIENANGARRYDGTFFHRSMPGFVVQGGGFAYDPVLGPFSAATAPQIEVDDPIVNEFDASRSNVRGTVAMAKLGGDPDSATSQWFFNLADNSANLDNQNGGFTVFGRVLGDGMTTVDSIAALPVENLGGNFSDLPLAAHTPGDPVTNANLVTLTRVEIIDAVTPAVLDFDLVAVGDSATDTVTVQNLTDSAITIDPIDPAALQAPFSIISETCSNAVLPSLATCSMQIAFQPGESGLRPGSFQLTTSSATFPSLTVAVKGTGAPQAATLVLSVTDALNFGDAGPGEDKQLGVTISNSGIDPLSINLLRFTGSGADQFSTTTNCSSLAFGDSCTETLTFSATTRGVPDVQFEIQSSDPAAPQTLVAVLATASGDHDGVPDAIESAAPNNGDGNADGIPDVEQDHVTSLPGIFGGYVTLETEPGLRLADVRAIDNPSSVTPTAGGATLTFPHGFFSFRVENVPVGGTATVTLHMPPGFAPSTYLKHGRLPGDFFLFPPRWYVFVFDGQTGARFSGNRIVLHFVDGARGDNDQVANGVIVDPGGPAVVSLDDSGSSGGGCTLSAASGGGAVPIDFVLLLLSLLVLRQRSAHGEA